MAYESAREHAAHHAAQACAHVEEAVEVQEEAPATAMLKAQIATGHGLAAIALLLTDEKGSE